MNALQKLDNRWKSGARICVGLDSRFELLPEMFRDNGIYNGLRAFNYAIIRHTKDLALAYKLNLAPYMRYGVDGIRALLDTFKFIRDETSDVLTNLDSKPGDALAEINADYAHFAFEQCGADAMTAQVYTGHDAAEGFTEKYVDKLIFFLCKTSNDGSADLQGLPVSVGNGTTRALYDIVAGQVSNDFTWNQHGNCGLVVGATHPHPLEVVRSIVGELPILSPGSGEQGGDLEQTIRVGIVPGLGRLIVSESRSIIYAPYDRHRQKYEDPDTFAEAARQKLIDRTAEYNKILQPAELQPA